MGWAERPEIPGGQRLQFVPPKFFIHFLVIESLIFRGHMAAQIKVYISYSTLELSVAISLFLTNIMCNLWYVSLQGRSKTLLISFCSSSWWKCDYSGWSYGIYPKLYENLRLGAQIQDTC